MKKPMTIKQQLARFWLTLIVLGWVALLLQAHPLLTIEAMSTVKGNGFRPEVWQILVTSLTCYAVFVAVVFITMAAVGTAWDKSDDHD